MVTDTDIQAFAEFAREQSARGGVDLTLAELAANWQAARERADVNSAIEKSLADIEAGRTEPVFESQNQFRRARQ